jgi:hypothetical protein
MNRHDFIMAAVIGGFFWILASLWGCKTVEWWWTDQPPLPNPPSNTTNAPAGGG